jgi:hypothetical protein
MVLRMDTAETDLPAERWPYHVQVTGSWQRDVEMWTWCCDILGTSFDADGQPDRWWCQDIVAEGNPITVRWLFASAEDAALFELIWG